MEQQSHILPPLSPNFQASQLLAPRQLERITIDQHHYHDHLIESVTTAQPPASNAVQRRTGTMGDSHFHLHKNLPVEQAYQKTALQLSQVRPWDQILERPLKSANMVKKEIDAPFPQEHPYTSHISRFAVFPDTFVPSSQGNLVDAQTQTGGPPPLYQVSEKAVENGRRIECHYLKTPSDVGVKSGLGTMLWDLPRSHRHKRAHTYPAPSLQYSRPSTAARYLPLPSTLNPSARDPSPASQEGLKKIHNMLTRTTTYSDQYSVLRETQPMQSFFQTGYLFRSRGSQRPWTAESRGKYNRVAIAARPDASCHFDTSVDHRRRPPHFDRVVDDGESEVSECEQPVPEKVDASTQTEEQYFEPLSGSSLLPSQTSDATKISPRSALHSHESRVRSTACPSLVPPRSTRKLVSLFSGFNKTDTLRQFHEEFPEQAPDLREYGIHEGRRHVIHGSNSYYYH